MFSKSKKLLFLSLVSMLALVISACGAAPSPETITVIETVIVEKEVAGETITVVETVVVEKEVEVEVIVVETVVVEVEVEAMVEEAPIGCDSTPYLQNLLGYNQLT